MQFFRRRSARPLPPPASPKYLQVRPGEIRILEISPGSGDDQIQCSLRHVTLQGSADGQDVPAYEAISYCWGDPTPSRSIICDGSRVTITESLHQALLHLRDAKSVRTLWADALCINQNDNTEKGIQVAGMRHVYAKATGVAIWVGEEDEASAGALDFVNECAERWAKDGRPSGATNKDGEPNPFQHVAAFNKGPVKGLLELVRRRWFSRVWVIQEVALASDRATIHVGRKTAKWTDFAAVCTWCVESGIAIYAPSALEKTQMLGWAGDQAKKTPNPKEDLLPLLSRFRVFDATDPKDKLYGLCGLADASSGENPYIRIDYSKTRNEVYKDFALTHLRQNANLDILSVPRMQESSGLPSWVPMWHVYDHAKSLVIEFKEKAQHWEAGGKLAPCVQLRNDDKELGLKGFVVDTIEIVGDAWKRQDIGSLSHKALVEIFDAVRYQLHTCFQWESIAKAQSQEPYGPTGESRHDVIWQVTIGGCSTPEEYESMKEKFENINISYRRHRLLHDLGLDQNLPAFTLGAIVMSLVYQASVVLGLKSAESLTPKDYDFNNAAKEVGGDRRLFRTLEHGYLGLGPRLAKAGDKVVLAQGVKAPLILRPCKEDSVFELVGDAYVQGLMKGEGFDQDKCKNIWLK